MLSEVSAHMSVRGSGRRGCAARQVRVFALVSALAAAYPPLAVPQTVDAYRLTQSTYRPTRDGLLSPVWGLWQSGTLDSLLLDSSFQVVGEQPSTSSATVGVYAMYDSLGTYLLFRHRDPDTVSVPVYIDVALDKYSSDSIEAMALSDVGHSEDAIFTDDYVRYTVEFCRDSCPDSYQYRDLYELSSSRDIESLPGGMFFDFVTTSDGVAQEWFVPYSQASRSGLLPASDGESRAFMVGYAGGALDQFYIKRFEGPYGVCPCPRTTSFPSHYTDLCCDPGAWNAFGDIHYGGDLPLLKTRWGPSERSKIRVPSERDHRHFDLHGRGVDGFPSGSGILVVPGQGLRVRLNDN